MARLEWDSAFATGIEPIDQQHRRIVGFINDLESARDEQGVGELLGELNDYALSHFSFEEALMEQAGFAEAAEHAQAHTAFEEAIEAFQERHARGEPIADELRSMLQGWLYEHIAEDDASYVPLVRRRLADSATLSPRWVEETAQRCFD